ncbi:hypothetical protein NSE_0353 [Neorickettsia sennetsu str. Miyayama]|uniref:Uncharacterized protein n=1 Tax=Ehrlichia sennetsu (strain ATCC VR-367 / Miyayama) TaxID=222891 RepID=Q2GE54_EHRS3|nr:hypothetical protein NSE_0353 [Neorickettsia sennetsu str. Miyayama]
MPQLKTDHQHLANMKKRTIILPVSAEFDFPHTTHVKKMSGTI